MGQTEETIEALLTGLVGSRSVRDAIPPATEALRAWFGFTSLAVLTRGRTGDLLLVGTSGRFRAEPGLPERLEPGEGPLGRVIASGRAAGLPSPWSGLAVPIGAPEEPAGVLAVEGAGDDLETRAALAASLFDPLLATAREVERLRRERDEARAEMGRKLLAEETKDRFISAVSHEFRTPLTSIRSFSEILLTHSPEEPETAREFLSIIHDESVRLSRLVNNLLDLSKMQAGRMEWDFLENDIEDVIRRATKSVASLAADRGVKIVVRTGSALDPFVFDRDKILQVLVNLLSNALKYSPGGSEVEVSAERWEGGARVRVRDHGPGISAEDRERVFQRFTRVGPRSSELPGTGLGLSITREIVTAHGGRIRVEPPPDGGSVFLFELPAVPRPEAPPEVAPDRAAPPEEPPVDRGDGVLVVDDDPHFRRFLRYELQRAGYVVREASSGLEAIRIARETPPDLVLLDLALGDISGRDVRAVLAADDATAPVPVVVISVEPEEVGASLTTRERVLRKPVNSAELIACVRRILGPPRPR